LYLDKEAYIYLEYQINVENGRAKIKLRVHSWGGLGSQLHALAIVFEIQNIYPRRKIKIIHHTSGVSRREFELKSILPRDILVKQIDDFIPKNESSITENYRKGRKFRNFIKDLLDKLLISSNPDRDNNLRRIRFWTFEIRGHYSRIPINIEFLDYLTKNLQTNSLEQNELENTLTIHYRLGDLLTLAEKTYVPSINLLKVIEDIYHVNIVNRILIFSDSIEVARGKLKELDKLTDKIDYSNAPTLTVINISLMSRYFIGTNSKVSFWIEVLRKHSGKESTIIGRN
jgi:hypothetical protein